MSTNGRGYVANAAETLDGATLDEHSSQVPSGIFPSSRASKRRDSGWSIAAQYEQDGFSYRVLRRPLEARTVNVLTRREEDAVVLARIGHSNKGIAQVMDVSPSTVGVLLFRAAAKLNAKSRAELIAHYEELKSALGAQGVNGNGDEPVK